MPVLRKILLTSAALASTVIMAHPSSAQPLAHSHAASAASTPRAGAWWVAYRDTNWGGEQKWFYGNVGDCIYVGGDWNDQVRSARGGSPSVRVELWDNANCTGGAITIDGSGYRSIGKWVSAYRVVSS